MNCNDCGGEVPNGCVCRWLRRLALLIFGGHPKEDQRSDGTRG